MSGYGVTGWGTSGYGGPAPATVPFGISGAVALSTHEVLVTLTRPPQDVSPHAPGDASDPASWLVTVPSAAATLEVATVTPAARPLQWVLRTVQALPDSLTTARVQAPGLLDASGGPVVEQFSADFLGVTELATSTPQRLADARLRSGADLANLPAPVAESTALGGTLVVVGGDYALVSGADLLRKLIVRRLIAAPGDFFHLPDYGVGLAVKQPLPASGVSRLKKRIEQQVLQEPDAQSVAVSISQSSTTLVVDVRVVQRSTGLGVSVALNTPIGQG